MESCPNIGGKEIRMRMNFAIFGIGLTLITIFFISYFNFQQLILFVFFPAFGTGVVLFETLDKTCIVYSFMGIKNMGFNYDLLSIYLALSNIFNYLNNEIISIYSYPVYEL